MEFEMNKPHPVTLSFFYMIAFRSIGVSAALAVLALVIYLGVTPSMLAQVSSYAYVTSQNADTVSVINTATNTVSATIPVGRQPIDVVITPDGTRVYAANSIPNTISVIDTSTNTVIVTIHAGNFTSDLAVTPDSKRLYALGQSGSIAVIDIIANTVIATIPVGDNTAAIQITPDGTRAYVTNQNSNLIQVIDTGTNKLIGTIPVGNNPIGGTLFSIAFTSDGSRAYVTRLDANTVSVINTATNTLIATIPVGNNPVSVSLSPDATRAYVANQVSGTISVISTATNTVVATIPVGGPPSPPVAPFGGGPSDVSFTPDGTRAYVVNIFSSTVSVIETATNTVIQDIGGILNPNAIAITPKLVSTPTPTPTPQNCLFLITPSTQDFLASGGTGTITVTGQAGCAYSSLNESTFVTLNSGATGTGTGTVTFTVAQNSSAARSVTIFVAGQNFTINQAAGVKSRKRTRFF
jgi:YVTN family beta-propeller protein